MICSTDFDVIIVGAGAAGCALAYRLTANCELQVLLVEAGPDERPETVSIPARWPETLSGPLDYGYSTVPQKAAGGRVFPSPRGRVLGGTTAINAMVYSLPGPDDLKTWGRGWSHNDCAGALKAMESHRGKSGPTRGTAGPAVNGPARRPNQLSADFVQAAIEAGHPAAGDINSPDGQGAGWFDLSIGNDGLRADAAQSYLRTNPARPNLTVWTEVSVEKLHFAGDTVTSVTIVRSGAEATLPVPGQLVLCAGAIDTPRLLLRSGVGPGPELRKSGIEPVLDLLGVGRNLQDHPSISVTWSSKKQIAPPDQQFAETTLLLRHALEAHGQTISIGFNHIALLPPDVVRPAHGATALIGLYEPHSRGFLTLNPADPDGPPLIDPGYFTDERDVSALTATVDIARTLGAQPALETYGFTELMPGPEVCTTAALETFVRQTATTYGHPVGTCAMGVSEMSVVDSGLKVHAISNLRIADGSVIPTIPGTAPSATIQMIGWRAAELILAEIDGAHDAPRCSPRSARV